MVREALPLIATPTSVPPAVEVLPPAGIAPASDPKEWPPWLLAAGALLAMAAGALITRGVGLRAAARGTSEESRGTRRLLLEVMATSEEVTEALSAMVRDLEDLARSRRGME